jgi:hypothetical protein
MKKINLSGVELSLRNFAIKLIELCVWLKNSLALAVK